MLARKMRALAGSRVRRTSCGISPSSCLLMSVGAATLLPASGYRRPLGKEFDLAFRNAHLSGLRTTALCRIYRRLCRFWRVRPSSRPLPPKERQDEGNSQAAGAHVAGAGRLAVAAHEAIRLNPHQQQRARMGQEKVGCPHLGEPARPPARKLLPLRPTIDDPRCFVERLAPFRMRRCAEGIFEKPANVGQASIAGDLYGDGPAVRIEGRRW
jgi:hypothetical protein